jgi:hypothetical protein
MVNRTKRDLARRLVEKFLSGKITNDDFVNEYPDPEKDDRAIAAIYDRLWGFWDDRQTHTVAGEHDLSPEGRAVFERCIAFLNSDLEYEWPPLKWRSLLQTSLRLIGLGRIADRRSDEWARKVRTIGKWEVWPFIREEDLARVSTPSQKVP